MTKEKLTNEQIKEEIVKANGYIWFKSDEGNYIRYADVHYINTGREYVEAYPYMAIISKVFNLRDYGSYWGATHIRPWTVLYKCEGSDEVRDMPYYRAQDTLIEDIIKDFREFMNRTPDRKYRIIGIQMEDRMSRRLRDQLDDERQRENLRKAFNR